MTTMQLPQFLGTFWFNSENAAQFQCRYFGNSANNFSTTPFWFGGAKIAPNQSWILVAHAGSPSAASMSGG